MLEPAAFFIPRPAHRRALWRAHAGTGADALPVALEGGALFDRAEHQAEADLRSDIDIGRGETVADEIIAARYRGFEHVHDSAKLP